MLDPLAGIGKKKSKAYRYISNDEPKDSASSSSSASTISPLLQLYDEPVQTRVSPLFRDAEKKSDSDRKPMATNSPPPKSTQRPSHAGYAPIPPQHSVELAAEGEHQHWRQRRTRMISTRLETMGACQTWIILLSPFIMLVLAAFLDAETNFKSTSYSVPEQCDNHLLTCTQNYQETIVHLTGVPPLTTFLRIMLYFKDANISDTDEDIFKQCGVSFQVIGAHHGDGWHTLLEDTYSSLADVCDGKHTCESFSLADLMFDQPGLYKGYSRFILNVTYTGTSSTQVAALASYRLSHESMAYIALVVFETFLLCCLTVYAILWWQAQMRARIRHTSSSVIFPSHESHQPVKGLRSWLPEQIYVSLLVVTIFFLQDPFWVASELIAGASAETPQWLMFLGDLSRALSMQTIWCLFLMLIDSLKFSQSPKRKFQPRKDHDLLLPGSVNSYGALGLGIGHTTVPHRAHLPQLAKSHPCSPFYADFLVPKLGLLFLGWGLAVSTCVFKYPSLCLPSTLADKVSALQMYFEMVSLGLLAMNAAWVIILVRCSYRTSELLKRTPYIASRYRQIAFRVLMDQCLVGLLLICVTYLWQIGRMLAQLEQHWSQAQLLRAWSQDMRRFEARFTFWGGGLEPVPGQLLALSFIVYTLVVAFSPPSSAYSSTEKKIVQEYLALEREISCEQDRSLFCLETAAWLMECAWQAYHDMDGSEQHFHSAASLISQAIGVDTLRSPRMDLSRLRLQPKHIINDLRKDIHAYLAVGDSCIVIAFRGSMSGTNLYTDLQLTQVLLPNLRPRRRGSKKRRLLSQLANALRSARRSPQDKSPNQSAHSSIFGPTGFSRTYSAEDVEIGHLYTIPEGSHERTDSEIGSVVGIGIGPEETGEGIGSPWYDEANGSAHTSAHTSPKVVGKISSNPDLAANINVRVPELEHFTPNLSPKGPTLRTKDPHRRRTTSDTSDVFEGEDICSSCFECLKKCISVVPLARQAFPRVHKGFWEAYLSVRGELLTSLRQLLGQKQVPVYITGHSLGGALASLAALDLQLNLQPHIDITLYTFGTPRVGNAQFTKLLNQNVQRSFRVVVSGDVVTVGASFLGMYRHGGVPVVLDPEANGTLVVGPTHVESMYLARASSSIFNHYLTRYRDCLESCFEPEELKEYMAKEFHSTNTNNLSLSKHADGNGGTGTGDAGKSAARRQEEMPDWMVEDRRSRK